MASRQGVEFEVSLSIPLGLTLDPLPGTQHGCVVCAVEEPGAANDWNAQLTAGQRPISVLDELIGAQGTSGQWHSFQDLSFKEVIIQLRELRGPVILRLRPRRPVTILMPSEDEDARASNSLSHSDVGCSHTNSPSHSGNSPMMKPPPRRLPSLSTSPSQVRRSLALSQLPRSTSLVATATSAAASPLPISSPPSPLIGRQAAIVAPVKSPKAACKVMHCDLAPVQEGFCEPHASAFIKKATRKSRRRRKPRSAKAIEDLFSELEQSWSCTKELVYKDLPRLAKRITITCSVAGDVVQRGVFGRGEMGRAIPCQQGSPAEISNWDAVSNCVAGVARAVETEDKQGRVDTALATFGASEMVTQPGLQPAVKSLFVNYVGTYSRTFRVFMAVHQEIISPTIFYLCKQLYNLPPLSLPLMKDVRARPDNWIVNIDFHPATIAVTHLRWDMAPVPTTSPECFYVRWQLSLTFDRDMAKLLSVDLAIVAYEFSDTMPAARREELTKALQGWGGYKKQRGG